MWLLFALGFLWGYWIRFAVQRDQAKKYGVLDIDGMKFVRMYEK